MSIFLNIAINNNCYAESSAALTLGQKNLSATTQNNIAYASSTIKAEAADASSYAISISGPVGLSGSSTITGASGSNPNGNTPANMPDNSWGYSYNEGSKTNENKTYKSFTGSAQQIESGVAPDGTAKNITFAVKFANNAVAGHYTGSVVVSLVATPKSTVYTLTLNNNNGTDDVTTKACSTSTTSCSISLSDATIPTKSGYKFLGWADSKNALSAQYTNSSTITMTASKTIYAVWQFGAPGFTGITNMQQMTSDICDSAAVGHYKDLIDARGPSGNNTYRVMKMPDEKCWMTQNLRLVNKTITSADSDVTSNYTIPAPDGEFDSDYIAQVAYYDANIGGIGGTGYYTWCTATAGTCPSSGIAPASICPKNWKMPTYNEYQLLRRAIGAYDDNGSENGSAADVAVMRSEPYNFINTGNGYPSGKPSGSATSGTWWTSNAYTGRGNIWAYTLYINSSGVFIGSRYPSQSYQGNAVRCIAR